jgi:hypothetical protein
MAGPSDMQNRLEKVDGKWFHFFEPPLECYEKSFSQEIRTGRHLTFRQGSIEMCV